MSSAQLRPLPLQHSGGDHLSSLSLILDPIGTSAPKFSIESKTSSLVRDSVKSLSLSCSAQSSPVPTFRFVRDSGPLAPVEWTPLTLHSLSAPLCSSEAWGWTALRSRGSVDFLSVPSVVVGNNLQFKQLTPRVAQHTSHLPLTVLVPEPIGTSLPKASSNVDPAVRVSVSSEHSLTCPVQASPRPSFRWECEICGAEPPHATQPTHYSQRSSLNLLPTPPSLPSI